MQTLNKIVRNHVRESVVGAVREGNFLHTSDSVADNSGSHLERVRRFLLVLLQLGLLATVVRIFHIEEQRHFFPVFCLIIGGFLIHTWLPRSQRIPFVALLSVASVLFVLGLTNGAYVICIGGTLIGVCYLPVSARMRILLLVSAAAALVYLRALHPFPFWPVVGSMFMFRLISFVYDCQHQRVMPPPALSIGYFFLFPNVCFPLFPVVDFRRFRETWYNDDEWKIYQQGITWMTHGLLHLLLYRYLRFEVVPPFSEVNDLPGMLFFMVTNYALYLQVSGQFHLIAGILHLFGFHLGRTHHWYFLASGCSDIWRRINIYWKDFLTKLFFFPAFFFLRGRGASAGTATVCSIIIVFTCTWLLHSWQTFWLLGRFPITANDAGLWLIAGVFVAINFMVQGYRGKRTQSEQSAWFAALSQSTRIVAMFLLVSVFWACWTRPGFLLTAQRLMTESATGHGLLICLMWICAAIVVGILVILIHGKLSIAALSNLQKLDFISSAKLHAAVLGLMIAATTPALQLFGDNLAQAMTDFRSGVSNVEPDNDHLLSYYEDLNTAAIQAGPLISSLNPQQEIRWEQAQGFYKVSRQADLYQQVELIPGVVTKLDGSQFSVNRLGMRDRNTVSLQKPASTIRLAMVGSSIVMGYGVSDEQVFSRVFESQLNQARLTQDRSALSSQIEVLNFGVGKHWAPHRLVRIQRLVLNCNPDAIYYFVHQDEFRELASHTAQLISNRLSLPSKHLQHVAELAMVTSDMPPGGIMSRLLRYESELLSATYRTIVDECRSRGIIAVWIYLPVPENAADQQAGKLIAIATDAGFIVCDLSDWANTRDGLFRAVDDHHPNARGHQLIADALFRMVQDRPETLPGQLLLNSPPKDASHSDQQR